MTSDGIQDGGMRYLEQEKRISECLVSVAAVGLQCSRQRPEERSCMRETAAEMSSTALTGAVSGAEPSQMD
ncbi:hypothetical protein KSP40_PGU014742 [Platanthera guangdongensis]|uniref:Uncharacterized protein n=1 Tax=Platanthera guangdongensis TaxID=2320717 RepID=A0ABR2LGP7_9ASPA